MEKFSILLALIALLVQMHGYKACFNKERSALLELKSFFLSISDREYADEILTSWVDDGISDCCDWERVTCDATAGQVIQLSLDFARMFDFYNSSDGFPILNFSLFLPFQELQILDLSGNYFDGWNENKGISHLFSYPSLSNQNQEEKFKKKKNFLVTFSFGPSLTNYTAWLRRL